jgi:hypothetical protein
MYSFVCLFVCLFVAGVTFLALCLLGSRSVQTFHLTIFLLRFAPSTGRYSIRDPICPGFPGTVPVLWILHNSVPQFSGRHVSRCSPIHKNRTLLAVPTDILTFPQ